MINPPIPTLSPVPTFRRVERLTACPTGGGVTVAVGPTVGEGVPPGGVPVGDGVGGGGVGVGGPGVGVGPSITVCVRSPLLVAYVVSE